ncbi:MAG: hypothetical protein GY807_17215 [Gammaproteobacteria bacterium]|nr:hypothetical protein [Gammaproteobacteria bacterium]
MHDYYLYYFCAGKMLGTDQNVGFILTIANESKGLEYLRPCNRTSDVGASMPKGYSLTETFTVLLQQEGFADSVASKGRL